MRKEEYNNIVDGMAYIGTFIQMISSIPLLVLIYLAHYYKKKGAMIGLVIALVGVNIFFTCMWFLSLNSELV